MKKNILAVAIMFCTSCAFAGCSVATNVQETIFVCNNIAEYGKLVNTVRAVVTRDLDSMYVNKKYSDGTEYTKIVARDHNYGQGVFINSWVTDRYGVKTKRESKLTGSFGQETMQEEYDSFLTEYGL